MPSQAKTVKKRKKRSPDRKVITEIVYTDQPNLILRYCALRCPIGRQCGWEVPKDGLAGSVLRYLKEQAEANAVQTSLLQDSCDGELDPALVSELADVAKSIIAMMIAANQAQKEAAPVYQHRSR